MKKKLRSISIDEMEQMQLDENNRLYWKGRPVVTEERVTFSILVNLSIIATGVATSVIAILSFILTSMAVVAHAGTSFGIQKKSELDGNVIVMDRVYDSYFLSLGIPFGPYSDLSEFKGILINEMDYTLYGQLLEYTKDAAALVERAKKENLSGFYKLYQVTDDLSFTINFVEDEPLLIFGEHQIVITSKNSNSKDGQKVLSELIAALEYSQQMVTSLKNHPAEALME
jgi:hypothetical protein